MLKLASSLFVASFLACCVPDADVDRTEGSAQSDARDDLSLPETEAAEPREAQPARAVEKATRKRFSFVERNKFRDAMHEDLVTLHAQIGDLDAQADRKKGVSKSRLIAASDELRARRKKLRAELDRIGGVTEAGWDAFQDEVDDDFVQLRGDLKIAFATVEKR